MSQQMIFAVGTGVLWVGHWACACIYYKYFYKRKEVKKGEI